MSYSERLHIPWLWAVIGLLFVASVTVAVVAYVPTGTAVAVIALTAACVTLGLVAYGRAAITVDPHGLSVGRYRLERAYVGAAQALEGEDARRQLGPEADHRAFLFTRPFIGSLVRVEIDDPADPHPYWLVSTRHPNRLARAIEELRAS